ncbi:hypothetical protein JJL53_24175 (plasmid) [Aeromonas media]|uniref:competence protein CoiA family protein n=1 Tax=Aeromonas media TaxID=651 RepID=UPI00191366AD|nr:competence protein CoiA family protein [Aeromonas media]QQQ15866.1 hypothetical protein JJL53_24175 [Aeromonas media]
MSVDDVPRGLKCDCHCPSCLGRLVARQGEKNVPHFSHFDRSSEKCEYAFATSVRLMLQEQFPALTGLNTPEHYVMVEGMRLQVAEASTGIPVRHVPQDTSQGTPAGLFQLVAHPDFHLAIHLPPAHEPDGVLGIFRPKTTKCSGGHAVRGLQRGITFLALHIASHNKSIT